jgi:hypothetical protein
MRAPAAHDSDAAITTQRLRRIVTRLAAATPQMSPPVAQFQVIFDLLDESPAPPRCAPRYITWPRPCPASGSSATRTTWSGAPLPRLPVSGSIPLTGSRSLLLGRGRWRGAGSGLAFDIS